MRNVSETCSRSSIDCTQSVDKSQIEKFMVPSILSRRMNISVSSDIHSHVNRIPSKIRYNSYWASVWPFNTKRNSWQHTQLGRPCIYRVFLIQTLIYNIIGMRKLSGTLVSVEYLLRTFAPLHLLDTLVLPQYDLSTILTSRYFPVRFGAKVLYLSPRYR